MKYKLVNNHRTCIDFGIVFTNSFLIENLIDSNSIDNYIYFVIKKIAIETIISLNIDIFIMKNNAGLILEAVEIDGDDINKKMILI